MNYPRWTGVLGLPPVLLGKASLIEYVKNYNGTKPVWVSVYAFDRWRMNKPYIQSAMLDTLYLKGDPRETIEHSRTLADNNIKHVTRYDGKYIDILVPLKKIYPHPLWEVVRTFRKVVDVPFSKNPLDLRLWSRTWNPKTKRYVIHILPTQDIEEIDSLATKPIKVKPTGGNYIDRIC